MKWTPWPVFCLPKIQAFFESEEGQQEFAKWKAQKKKNRTKQE